MSSKSRDIEYFSNIPWCATHINEPGITTATTPSRIVKPSGEDALFGHTLNTDKTIKAYMVTYKKPVPTEADPEPFLREFKFFISLGTGLNGYPGTCHGGIVATIMDEITGLSIVINRSVMKRPEGSCMTGQLNVTFKKPVPLPGDYLCRATIEKIEGRKFFVTGSIEDEAGTILAHCEAIYIEIKNKL